MSREWSSTYGKCMAVTYGFAGAIFVLLAPVSLGVGQVLAAIACIALGAMLAILALICTVVRLEIRDDELLWWMPARSGAVALSAITGARRPFGLLSWNTWFIYIEGQKPISLWGGPKLGRWLDGWGLKSPKPAD